MTVLDNPAWAALTTYQSQLALGGTLARRYPADVTSIGAIAMRTPAALEELADLVPAGQAISLPATLEDLPAVMPSAWTIVLAKNLVQMVCERRIDVSGPDTEFSLLGEHDVADMLALTDITHPGPFRERTYTLGTYLGLRREGRLAAMGGQRMHMPGYREISAIAVHPEFQGRGLGRTIVKRLVALTFEQGATPFLHFEENNLRAQALYTGLGFVERRRMPLLVLARRAEESLKFEV